MMDNAAYLHDISYFKAGVSGVSGALFNHSPVITLADRVLYKRALEVSRMYREGGHIDPFTKKPISELTYNIANAVIVAFGSITIIKAPLSTAQEHFNNFYNSLR